MTSQELIFRIYAAFNSRDIDATLALMSDDVSWPKASEGGRAVGKQAIREYWARQWAEFDPHVDPFEVTDREDGTIEVKVHQLVQGLNGDILSDTDVRHVYTVANGLIERMDIEDGTEGTSTAFSRS
jgi:hypothetical protein